MLPHYATLSIIILFHLLCGSLFIPIHISSLKRHWLQSSSQIEQHKWNKWNIYKKTWILRYTFTSICIIFFLKKTYISDHIFQPNHTTAPSGCFTTRLFMALIIFHTLTSRWRNATGRHLCKQCSNPWQLMLMVTRIFQPSLMSKRGAWWSLIFFNYHENMERNLR